MAVKIKNKKRYFNEIDKKTGKRIKGKKIAKKSNKPFEI